MLATVPFYVRVPTAIILCVTRSHCCNTSNVAHLWPDCPQMSSRLPINAQTCTHTLSTGGSKLALSSYCQKGMKEQVPYRLTTKAREDVGCKGFITSHYLHKTEEDSRKHPTLHPTLSSALLRTSLPKHASTISCESLELGNAIWILRRKGGFNQLQYKPLHSVFITEYKHI